MSRVLIISPAAAGAEGGVCAFAAAFAARLEGAEWLQIEGTAPGQRAVARSLRAAGPRGRVEFHYANYGFTPRGCPAGLVGQVAGAREGGRIASLVTVFHEVFAFGPPWRSSFWLSPVQRYLARRVALASDACVTSNEPFAAILRRWIPAERIHVLPVFSTIGEPEETRPWEVRTPCMIVFGSSGVRERAYRRTRDQLSRVAEALRVEEVIDIGMRVAAPESLFGVPVSALGHRPAAEVGRLLGSSRFGFVAYPPHLLGKSSILAAYEAHGLCPVIGWPSGRREGAEGEGVRWLPAWGRAPGEAGPREVAAGAQGHYASHSLARHVKLHRRLLAPCAS